MICMVQWRSMTASALPWIPKPVRIGTWCPPWLRQHPGRHPTYRDLRAPEVPEGRAQCHLALWTKGVQDLGPWDRIPSARHNRNLTNIGSATTAIEDNMTSREE